MGKSAVLGVMLFVLIPFNSFGSAYKPAPLTPSAAVLTAPVKATGTAGSLSVAGWVFLGIDAVMTGISAYMIVDERKTADDYEKLYNAINNTSAANYRLLKDKKSAGENKALAAGTVSGITVFFLCATVADALWLHTAFGEEVKAAFAPENGEVKITLNKRF